MTEPLSAFDEKRQRRQVREAAQLRFDLATERVPDVQAPNVLRRGQRLYLSQARRVYARHLIGQGFNRASRRQLAKGVRLS